MKKGREVEEKTSPSLDQMPCFFKALYKKHAAIVRYLLDQDVQPLSESTLRQSMVLATLSLAAAEDIKAVNENLQKLIHVHTAKAALAVQQYMLCVEECEHAAKFKIEQYNEALFEVCYQAYLGLKEQDKAVEYLTRYLLHVQTKHDQVLAPSYKTQIYKKIVQIQKKAEAGQGVYQQAWQQFQQMYTKADVGVITSEPMRVTRAGIESKEIIAALGLSKNQKSIESSPVSLDHAANLHHTSSPFDSTSLADNAAASSHCSLAKTTSVKAREGTSSATKPCLSTD